ncbi:MAG: ATP-binding cassette domain-containing protein [Candidatus Eisenbacteria bacterium]|uniref:ATP-binding cassette domain-containing protein n=1 Tax=Eiseniibacteriota bacterium TaxID=2212470 RepID=A0A849SC81_UNCEI|nr:ATP-binding cassette domain-containing protein [Candidatus Eisenbacteria bacterium]
MTPALLEVRSIAKRYGDLQAVHPLTFEVRRGEIFGFLGPNGAGKTTTLRMLLGITRPDGGEVRFDGARGLDPMRAGYLPEERGLFDDMPILETLVYLGELHGMRASDARTEATTWLDRFGLADRARTRLGILSKGNQQKVQLAAALLHRPALAVLDEPFSGLDPLNQELLFGVLNELCASGSAVLLSAHQLDLVERLAHRFLLISRGRAVLQGTLDEIRHDAAGGAAEVLALRLDPHPGATLDADAVHRAVAGPLAGAEATIRHAGDGSLTLEAPLAAGSDLAPWVAAVAPHARVRAAESRRLRLHEIYLRAVGEEVES